MASRFIVFDNERCLLDVHFDRYLDIFVPSIIDEIYIYIYVGNGFFRKRIGRALFSFHLVVDDNIAGVLLPYINKMVEKPIRSARGEMYRNFTMIALVIVFKNK